MFLNPKYSSDPSSPPPPPLPTGAFQIKAGFSKDFVRNRKWETIWKVISRFVQGEGVKGWFGDFQSWRFQLVGSLIWIIQFRILLSEFSGFCHQTINTVVTKVNYLHFPFIFHMGCLVGLWMLDIIHKLYHTTSYTWCCFCDK